MNRSKVIKILVLLVVMGLIIIQAYKVEAATIDEILGPDGSGSSLETGNGNSGSTGNDGANGSTNTTDGNNLSGVLTGTGTNTAGTGSMTNKNTTLPKTGTNENIIIGLMVICTVAGIYAFKKVKDYNM